MIKQSEAFTVNHKDSLTMIDDTLAKGVVSYVNSQLDYFKRARNKKEDIWLECWALYLGSDEARQYMKGRVFNSVGATNNDWRHSITTGKAFEQVETVLAYLQQAFFPNREWFDVQPLEPGYMELVDLVKQFSKKKFIESKFVSHWEMFLRQMLIVGSSVLALPWRQETAKYKKKVKIRNQDYGTAHPYGQKAKFKTETVERIIQNHPDFETLDMFDCFLDPRAIDINDSDFVRRIVKSKAELVELIDAGFYKNIDKLEVVKSPAYSRSDTDIRANNELLKRFQGFEIEDGYHWHQGVEIFEYWGNVTVNGVTYKDVVATILGDKLLRFENNPFYCGKPFVFGTYTPVVRSTSALGLIEPGLGMLHELDILTNQRLDNLELSIDSMWEYINDGTLAPEDIYTKPGRVFTVNQPDTIRPIKQSQNFTITYEESAVLESRIDKNAGTGNLIGANAARDAERVTAAEVRATRDAGGNRLSGVHKHIEETALIPCLDKVFKLFQQFVKEDEIVRVPGMNPGEFEFAAVGEEELMYDFKIYPVGADFVADKEFEVSQRLQFLNLVSSNPQMSQHINFYNFMIDLARRMGIDDIDQFVQDQVGREDAFSLEQGGGQPMPPGGGLNSPQSDPFGMGLQEAGGKTLEQTVQSNLNADGGVSMMQALTGVNAALPPQLPQQ